MNYVIDRYLAEITHSAKDVLGARELVIEPANSKFGADFAIPCFKLAAELQKSPIDIANTLAAELKHDALTKAEAVNGFVNLWLSDAVLAEGLSQVHEQKDAFGEQQILKGKKLVIETNNPNPFKDLHIGHAYNSIVADTLANVLEAGGGEVHRMSYHGDVGLHVGKSMWAILGYVDGDPKKLDAVKPEERADFLSKMYVQGAGAYDDDPTTREQIEAFAKESFELKDPLFKQVYETCKTWSFDYLDDVITRIGSKPAERRYLESEADKLGRKVVEDHMSDIFEHSDGAIVFPGEKYDLHTRVFISSRDTTLYEARDLGLIQLKHRDFHPDTSYIVTAEEQREYFNVVFKAAELAIPDTKGETKNISTGTVKLSTGKMSSRTGKIINIEWIFDALREAAVKRGAEETTLQDALTGSLRYAMLKVKIGSDIVFDIAESVSIEGNSGPYLQYAYARGRSILAKLGGDIKPTKIDDLTEDERALARKLLDYPSVVADAVNELAPHNICTYLYELTQTFNRFYEKNRIIDDPRQNVRANLVQAYSQVLKNGLTILGIPAPQRL
ncbi:MAG: arginine--tRNA ligase [Candidatus Saccharimonadales bacterium]